MGYRVRIKVVIFKTTYKRIPYNYNFLPVINPLIPTIAKGRMSRQDPALISRGDNWTGIGERKGERKGEGKGEKKGKKGREKGREKGRGMVRNDRGREKRGRRVFRYNRSRCGSCNLASLLSRTPRRLIDGANISSWNYTALAQPSLLLLLLPNLIRRALRNFTSHPPLSISWIKKFQGVEEVYFESTQLRFFSRRKKWWSCL